MLRPPAFFAAPPQFENVYHNFVWQMFQFAWEERDFIFSVLSNVGIGSTMRTKKEQTDCEECVFLPLSTYFLLAVGTNERTIGKSGAI